MGRKRFKGFKEGRILFAVVPHPGTTCPYCIMLGSRGAVYSSAHEAERSKHTSCGCEVVPIPDGESIPGYDPDALFDQWGALGRSRDIAFGNKTVSYDEYFGDETRFPSDHRPSDHVNSATKRFFENKYPDMDGIVRYLNTAASVKDLEQRCKDISAHRSEFTSAEWSRLQKVVAEKKQSIIKGFSYMKSLNDPAVEYFGSAEIANPIGLEAIKSELREDGVEISYTENSIGYGPSVIPGEPGNMKVTEGMSFQAWRHEYDHYLQDKELGFPGLIFYLEHQDKWDEIEVAAYSIEIEDARVSGYNELAERLIHLLVEDFKSRGRTPPDVANL